MHQTVSMLKLFEKDIFDKYLAREAHKENSSMDARLQMLDKK